MNDPTTRQLKERLVAPLNRFSHQELKDIQKEAITEWLDDKFKAVGKWTIRGIVALALAALTAWFVNTHGGWKP